MPGNGANICASICSGLDRAVAISLCSLAISRARSRANLRCLPWANQQPIQPTKMPMKAPTKNNSHKGRSIETAGVAWLNGSNESCVHRRLAIAKPMTTIKIGTPINQRKMRRKCQALSFRRRRSSFPVLKNGTRFSVTSTASPVRGLRPRRALRFCWP